MLIVSLSSLNFQAALGHGYFLIPIDIRVLLAIKGLPIIMDRTAPRQAEL